MNPSELSKKLEESIRGAKCSNKGCLSGGKDNLDIVWFGNQYEQKIITCSSCYVMNDEAIKKSIPTAQNVMPLRLLNRNVVRSSPNSSARPKRMRNIKAPPNGCPATSSRGRNSI